MPELAVLIILHVRPSLLINYFNSIR